MIMFSRLLVALPFCGVIASVPKPLARSRFRFNGPILTITIPSDLSSLSSEFETSPNEEKIVNSYSDSSVDSIKMKRSINKILKRRMKSVEHFAHSICETLRPICVYSIATRQPPLPYWCPALKACSARVGYAHHMEADERTVLPASGFMDHSSSLSSDAAVTQKASLMQPHPSSNVFIEGISKFEFNLMNRNDVLQLAIKPCWEWVTSRTRGIPHRISEHEQPQSTIRVSSSSVLFHARRHSSSYAWVRFMSSSSVPLFDSGKLNDENRFDPCDSESETKTQETVYDRWFETTMRISTLISLPLAYVASIRVTPTFRCIQMLTPSQHRMRKERSLEKRTTHIDASCQLEATSGGQGRTTATLTVSPLDTAQYMKLAMEYQLSGFVFGVPFFRRRRGTENKVQAQSPQHWIRQIWEWNRPDLPLRSSVREKESFMMKRYRSAKTTILASQYQWLMVWPSGQSFRTIFDPPRDDFQHGDGKMNGAVSFTWIDPTKESIHDGSNLSGGGVGGWITELRIPFLDASRNDDSHLQDELLVRNLGAAEVRVRRQFCF